MEKNKPYSDMGFEEWLEKFDLEDFAQRIRESHRAAEAFGRELDQASSNYSTQYSPPKTQSP